MLQGSPPPPQNHGKKLNEGNTVLDFPPGRLMKTQKSARTRGLHPAYAKILVMEVLGQKADDGRSP